MLTLAAAGRGEHHLLGLIPLGIVTVAVVFGFLVATVWLFPGKQGQRRDEFFQAAQIEKQLPHQKKSGRS